MKIDTVPRSHSHPSPWTRPLCKTKAELLRPFDVAFYKIADVLRNIVAFDVAAGLDFLRDLWRYVLGPVLKGIEGDYPNRVTELACHEVRDDGL